MIASAPSFLSSSAAASPAASASRIAAFASCVGTVAMMEIGARYRAEQPESLERARKLQAINDCQKSIAAE